MQYIDRKGKLIQLNVVDYLILYIHWIYHNNDFCFIFQLRLQYLRNDRISFIFHVTLTHCYYFYTIKGIPQTSNICSTLYYVFFLSIFSVISCCSMEKSLCVGLSVCNIHKAEAACFAYSQSAENSCYTYAGITRKEQVPSFTQVLFAFHISYIALKAKLTSETKWKLSKKEVAANEYHKQLWSVFGCKIRCKPFVLS